MKKIFFTLVLMCGAICLNAREYKVASFNIRNPNGDDYKHNDGWNQRKGLLCDMVAYSDWDIWGAQEVKKVQLDDILAALPQYGYVGVGRDDGKEEGEYSPVFYNKERFDIIKCGWFWLSETPEKVSMGWDAACTRICSYAFLKDKTDGTQILFCNTHLDHVGITARREGVKLVLSRIEEIAGKNANVVITGDFNVDQRSEAYETMLSTGFLKDSYEASPVHFAPGGTFNGWEPSRYNTERIDHIFVSSSAKVLRYAILTYMYWEDSGKAEWKKRKLHPLSDHFPITATVEF